MLRKSLTAAVLFSFLSANAFASGRALSLKEALDIGLKENLELKASASSTAASKEDIGVARSALLPKVFFEERFTRTNNPTFAFSSKLNQERFTQDDFAIASLNNPDAINDFQTSLSFEQPVYVRRARLGIRMAKEEYAAKQDDHARKRELTAFEIARTYIMVNTASEFIKVAEKGMEEAREHLRIAEARNDSGLGLLSDVLRARTGLVEAEQRLVTARKELRVARRMLGLLLGVDDEISASESVAPLAFKELDYYLSSTGARSDIRSMSKRYDNAKNGVALARADYFPMLGVGGSYFLNDHETLFGSEGQSWQVAAFLRWNIFDGMLGSHEAGKAKHRANEAFFHLDGLKKTASFNVRCAWLDVEEAMKKMELSEAALKSSEEGERLLRLRYENSLSQIVELLDAQLSVERARANHVMSKDALASALLDLSLESGTILKDLGVQ